MQWFRFYSETLNDPKVQNLDPIVFKIWVNCLCLASSLDSKDGNIGTIDDVSFAFRETKDAVSSAFHTLKKSRFIVTVNETFQIINWSKRQYKSDISTNRVREYRKRSKTVSCNGTETPQTRTRPEQIHNRPEQKESGFEKNGFGGLVGRFELTDDTLEKLPSVAPGWNVQRLLELYEPHRKKMGKADHPQAAFIGWAKNFTKGMRPS